MVKKCYICTAKCRSSQDLMHLAIDAFSKKWKEEPCERDGCALYWVMNQDDMAARISVMLALPEFPLCRVSRFPGMSQLCSKFAFSRILNRMKDWYPEHFGFWPKTWLLPNDRGALIAAMNENGGTFIVKPDSGSQGDGIFLTQSESDLRCKLDATNVQQAVVQEYLTQPLLLDGLKFDLRLYALVTSVSPLRVYMCREGLARFCTEEYHEPERDNLRNVYGHLTNYTLNKRNDKFAKSEDPLSATMGSKRSWIAVLQRLEEEGIVNGDEFMEQVGALMSHTLHALQPNLAEQYLSMFCGKGNGQSCLQILGFDVMIDHEKRPWLLEVNNSPSLAIDCPIAVPEGMAADQFLAQIVAHTPAKLCKVSCMDFAGPHLHAQSAIDVAIKVPVLTGALQFVHRHLRSGTVDVDVDNYTLVCPHPHNDLPELTRYARLANLYHKAGYGTPTKPPKIDSSRFRRFVTQVGLCVNSIHSDNGEVNGNDVDRLFMKAKQQNDNEVDFLLFCDMLQDLSLRRWPDAGRNGGLAMLLVDEDVEAYLQ